MRTGDSGRRSGDAVRAVSARRARTERYRTALGAMPHVVVLIDDVGLVLDISEEVETKLGYAPDDVVGRPVFDFLHPADHQLAAIELIRELEPNSRADPIICRLRHCDRRWIEFEVIGTNQLADPGIGGIVLALRDASGRRLGDRVLAAGDYLYSSLATVASDATTIFDGAGQRVYVSASFGPMLGFSHEELLAIPPSGLVYNDDVGVWRDATRRALAVDDATVRVELRLLRADGTTMWIEATVVNMLSDSGVRGVVVHARDIDARRRMEESLRLQATRDQLTGLANRYALMEEIENLANREVDHGGHALLFCDLDGFKAINDTHGHAAGDQVLIEVARQVSAAVRPADFVARIGGDEFCILGRGVCSSADGRALAERVRDAILARTLNPVGVSIGVAWVPCGPVDADQLLTLADRAMYRAKKAGTNRIEVALGAPDAVVPDLVVPGVVVPGVGALLAR